MLNELRRLNKGEKMSDSRIELETSRSQNENHTTRPIALLKIDKKNSLVSKMIMCKKTANANSKYIYEALNQFRQ